MKNISAAELKQWIVSGKSFQLLDVREDFEREIFHIGGQHIPLGELMSRREELSKEEPLVIYCAKGIRSIIAAQRLLDAGFSEVYNLVGGVSNLSESEFSG